MNLLFAKVACLTAVSDKKTFTMKLFSFSLGDGHVDVVLVRISVREVRQHVHSPWHLSPLVILRFYSFTFLWI